MVLLAVIGLAAGLAVGYYVAGKALVGRAQVIGTAGSCIGGARRAGGTSVSSGGSHWLELVRPYSCGWAPVGEMVGQGLVPLDCEAGQWSRASERMSL